MVDATFEYADSRWQDIFLHLQKSGIDVYSPGTKDGECTSRYIVVKNDGSSKLPNISTEDDLYSIMCYVPKEEYSLLEPFVQKTKKIMKDLEPMILPYGSQTPSYYDDRIKAHMVSIMYKNHKKSL